MKEPPLSLRVALKIQNMPITFCSANTAVKRLEWLERPGPKALSPGFPRYSNMLLEMGKMRKHRIWQLGNYLEN
ncbi:MAG: hypothetical protein ABSF60_16195 [Verrucomicrobiota bacterium]